MNKKIPKTSEIYLKLIDSKKRTLMKWRLKRNHRFELGSYHECQIQLPHWSVKKFHGCLNVSVGGVVSVQSYGVGSIKINGESVGQEGLHELKRGDILRVEEYKNLMTLVVKDDAAGPQYDDGLVGDDPVMMIN
jgi:hypothetical protein